MTWAQYRPVGHPLGRVPEHQIKDLLDFYAWESWFHIRPGSTMSPWLGAWLEVEL